MCRSSLLSTEGNHLLDGGKNRVECFTINSAFGFVMQMFTPLKQSDGLKFCSTK